MQNTEEFLGFGKKAKARRIAHRKQRKATGHVTHKGWLKFRNAVEKKGTNVALNALLPFKVLMKQILDKHGIAHTNKIQDISIKFYTMITGKKPDFVSSFDGEGNEYFVLTTAFIIGMVAKIIEFFKKVHEDNKARKAQGAPTSKASDIASKAYVKGAEVVQGVAKETNNTPPKPPETKKTSPLLLIGLGLSALKLLK